MIDPWRIERVTGGGPDHHLETLFTIGNGHVSLRGTTLEGRPGEEAASFMHAVWDDMPVSRSELANLPRWWGLDVWINERPLQPGVGAYGPETWSLDLRNGCLTRRFTWSPDEHTDVELADERFLSLDEPHLGAVRLHLTVRRGTAAVRLRGGLSVHVDNLGLRHWDLQGQSGSGPTVSLTARTRATAIDLAVAAHLDVPGADLCTCDATGQPAVEATTLVPENATLVATKLVAIASSAETADPAACVAAVLPAAAAAGWDALLARHNAAWAGLWADCDVQIEGDPAADQAVRYNLFQLLSAAPRIADSSIGAKTLSGFGYRHHVFWDTEIFMLPFFSLTQPALARRMLAYRWRRLDGARRKALASGAAGARFPWESAGTGDEVCPTWVEDGANPGHLIRIWTGDLELHLDADLAYACLTYWHLTGDDDFMAGMGAELILDTATFWATAATLEADGSYHYRNVIGPDEYHEQVDDNAYTNLMAQWHLRQAPRVLDWLDANRPAVAARLRAELGIDAARVALWLKVADGIATPAWRGQVMEQCAGFFGLTDVDFALARDPARTLSMQQVYGIEGTHHTQNLKQPDVLMLAYLLPETFTGEQLLANYHYYDPRTDHELGSSLGPSISAIMACRVGDAAAAYRHFQRAASADLDDVRGNAHDGLHGASAGGLWQAVVFGFAGLTIDETGWSINPRLPAAWTSLKFAIRWRGVRHEIVATRA